jgi:hypothetical protein
LLAALLIAGTAAVLPVAAAGARVGDERADRADPLLPARAGHP